jgi:predicted nucleic acid-binding protein
MADIVLDASALGKLFRNEPGSQALRRLVHAAATAGEDVTAPPIARHEVLNIVARTVQEGALAADGGFDHYAHVMALVKVADFTPRHDYTLAVETGITAHDAAYIALAESTESTLVSYDKKQLRAAAGRVALAAPGCEDLLPR